MKDLIWKLQKKTVPLLLILWNCVTNLCSITRKKNQCFTEICFYCESYTDEHQKRWKKWQKQITTSLEKENILQKTREECSFHFSWWRCEVYSFRHCFVECDIIVCYYSVIYLRVVKIVTFFFRVSDTTCLLPIGYYGCYTLTIRKTDVINQNVLQGIEEHWHVAPIKVILDWQIYKTLKKPPWKKKELYLMEKILLTIFTTKLPSGSTPKFRYSFSVETIDS